MRRVLRIHEPLVDSTMNAILGHVQFLEDEPEGLVVFSADAQTAGRGREGRTWVTAGKAVATSFAIKVRKDPTLLHVLALVITEALDELYHSQEFKVKWPNDILLRDRKVGGMLAEWHDDVVVLGFGLNLKVAPQSLPEMPIWPAGSIEHMLDIARSYEPSQIVESVISRVLKIIDSWESFGFGRFSESFNKKLFNRGRFVTVNSEDEPIRGLLEGVNEKGQLLLRVRSGQLSVIGSGEILFVAISPCRVLWES